MAIKFIKIINLMKKWKLINYRLLEKSYNILFFLVFIFVYQVDAQPIFINNTSPKQKIVTAAGELGFGKLNYVRNPMALCFDTYSSSSIFSKKIILSWFLNIDSAGPDPIFARMTSLDGGKNWGVKSGGTITDNVYLGSSIKTKAGKIVAISFKPIKIYPLGSQTYNFEYYTSDNNGDSWNRHTDGVADFSPKKVTSLRFHKGIIEEPDGVLYTNAYVNFSDSAFMSYILKSTDTGKTWKPMFDTAMNPIFVGIGHPNNGYSTNESTLERCANGDWLVVMRQQVIGGPLLISRSSDKGLSWTPLNKIEGLPYYPRHIDPKLMLMSNGVMVLSYGRPDQHLLFSPDGNGYHWTNEITTYKDSLESHPTSANSYIVPVGPNKLLQFGDYYGKTQNPNMQGIWQKEIEIVRPEQNRIDLKTKKDLSLITIMPQTTLIYNNPAHPEARTTGVFDGSTNYWSGALGTNKGVYQLDLQKVYTIKTIGIAMLYGKKQSSVIELSQNGKTWKTIKTYANATHYCLNYTNISPFSARYVRITLNGSGQIGLGELELYETSDTFEGNATTPAETIHGIIPPDYTFYGTSDTQHGMSVRDNVGYKSKRGLVLNDNSEDWVAGIKKISTASNLKTLEFRCHPINIPNEGSLRIKILGTVSGVEDIVFNLAILSDGSIKANIGSGLNKVIGGPGTVPVGIATSWKLIKVVANEFTNQATVYINGVLKGVAPIFSVKTNTTNLTGFGFTSNGTSTSGELVYFDDINFY